MSLPLSRRIARAALLVGAVAAPLAGAGAASAAALPQAPALGGLTNVDGAGVTPAVDGAAKQLGTALGDVNGNALKTAAPGVGEAAGGLGKGVIPAAYLGETTGKATGLVGDAPATKTTKPGPVGSDLPDPSQLLDELPAKGLPLQTG